MQQSQPDRIPAFQDYIDGKTEDLPEGWVPEPVEPQQGFDVEAARAGAPGQSAAYDWIGGPLSKFYGGMGQALHEIGRGAYHLQRGALSAGVGPVAAQGLKQILPELEPRDVRIDVLSASRMLLDGRVGDALKLAYQNEDPSGTRAETAEVMQGMEETAGDLAGFVGDAAGVAGGIRGAFMTAPGKAVLGGGRAAAQTLAQKATSKIREGSLADMLIGGGGAFAAFEGLTATGPEGQAPTGGERLEAAGEGFAMGPFIELGGMAGREVFSRILRSGLAKAGPEVSGARDALAAFAKKNGIYPVRNETMPTYGSRLARAFVDQGAPGAKLPWARVKAWLARPAVEAPAFSFMDTHFRDNLLGGTWELMTAKTEAQAAAAGDRIATAVGDMGETFFGLALLHTRFRDIIPWQARVPNRSGWSRVPKLEATAPGAVQAEAQGKERQEARQRGEAAEKTGQEAAKRQQGAEKATEGAITVKPGQEPVNDLWRMGWRQRTPAKAVDVAESDATEAPPEGAKLPDDYKSGLETVIELPGTPHTYEIIGNKAIPSASLRRALGLPYSTVVRDFPLVELEALLDSASQFSTAQAKAILPGEPAGIDMKLHEGSLWTIRMGEVLRSDPTATPKWELVEGKIAPRQPDEISPQQQQHVGGLIEILNNKQDLDQADRAKLSVAIDVLKTVSAERDHLVAGALQSLPLIGEAIAYGPPEVASQAIGALTDMLTIKAPEIALQELAETPVAPPAPAEPSELPAEIEAPHPPGWKQSDFEPGRLAEGIPDPLRSSRAARSFYDSLSEGDALESRLRMDKVLNELFGVKWTLKKDSESYAEVVRAEQLVRDAFDERFGEEWDARELQEAKTGLGEAMETASGKGLHPKLEPADRQRFIDEAGKRVLHYQDRIRGLEARIAARTAPAEPSGEAGMFAGLPEEGSLKPSGPPMGEGREARAKYRAELDDYRESWQRESTEWQEWDLGRNSRWANARKKYPNYNDPNHPDADLFQAAMREWYEAYPQPERYETLPGAPPMPIPPKGRETQREKANREAQERIDSGELARELEDPESGSLELPTKAEVGQIKERAGRSALNPKRFYRPMTKEIAKSGPAGKDFARRAIKTVDLNKKRLGELGKMVERTLDESVGTGIHGKRHREAKKWSDEVVYDERGRGEANFKAAVEGRVTDVPDAVRNWVGDYNAVRFRTGEFAEEAKTLRRAKKNEQGEYDEGTVELFKKLPKDARVFVRDTHPEFLEVVKAGGPRAQELAEGIADYGRNQLDPNNLVAEWREAAQSLERKEAFEFRREMPDMPSHFRFGDGTTVQLLYTSPYEAIKRMVQDAASRTAVVQHFGQKAGGTPEAKAAMVRARKKFDTPEGPEVLLSRILEEGGRVEQAENLMLALQGTGADILPQMLPASIRKLETLSRVARIIRSAPLDLVEGLGTIPQFTGFRDALVGMVKGGMNYREIKSYLEEIGALTIEAGHHLMVEDSGTIGYLTQKIGLPKQMAADAGAVMAGASALHVLKRWDAGKPKTEDVLALERMEFEQAEIATLTTGKADKELRDSFVRRFVSNATSQFLRGERSQWGASSTVNLLFPYNRYFMNRFRQHVEVTAQLGKEFRRYKKDPTPENKKRAAAAARQWGRYEFGALVAGALGTLIGYWIIDGMMDGTEQFINESYHDPLEVAVRTAASSWLGGIAESTAGLVTEQHLPVEERFGRIIGGFGQVFMELLQAGFSAGSYRGETVPEKLATFGGRLVPISKDLDFVPAWLGFPIDPDMEGAFKALSRWRRITGKQSGRGPDTIEDDQLDEWRALANVARMVRGHVSDEGGVENVPAVKKAVHEAFGELSGRRLAGSLRGRKVLRNMDPEDYIDLADREGPGVLRQLQAYDDALETIASKYAKVPKNLDAAEADLDMDALLDVAREAAKRGSVKGFREAYQGLDELIEARLAEKLPIPKDEIYRLSGVMADFPDVAREMFTERQRRRLDRSESSHQSQLIINRWLHKRMRSGKRPPTLEQAEK